MAITPTLSVTTPLDRYAEWWSAALSDPACPALIRAIAGTTARVSVDSDTGRDVLSWASRLPGWTIDTPHRSLRHPLRLHGAGRGYRPLTTGRGSKTGKRIDITASVAEYEAIERAASERGVTMAAFVLETALAAIREAELAKQIAKAAENPPPPPPALISLFKKHGKP